MGYTVLYVHIFLHGFEHHHHHHHQAVFLIRSSSWSGSSRSTKLACYNIQQTCSIYPAPFSEACQRHAVNAINFCSENPLNIITRMALSSILRKMLVHRWFSRLYCWCSNKVHVLKRDCDISLMLNLQMCNIVVKRNELVVFFNTHLKEKRYRERTGFFFSKKRSKNIWILEEGVKPIGYKNCTIYLYLASPPFITYYPKSTKRAAKEFCHLTVEVDQRGRRQRFIS